MLLYQHIESSEEETERHNLSYRIKSFAKEKPLKFGLMFFGIIALTTIMITVPNILIRKPESIISIKSLTLKAPAACDKNQYSDECLYQKMIAKKSEYPEGMSWTNNNYYAWKGGIFSGGYGCAAFSFMLSDVCFGTIKATKVEPCPSSFKVGDVVRINGDSHFVIILKIDTSKSQITIAEGNYNKSIHWGRTYTIQGLKNTCNYVLRRNPN